MTRLSAALLACSLFAPAARALPGTEAPLDRRLWIGTSLFMAGNLVPDDHLPAFYQLNVGYRLTAVDLLSIEAITWRYYHPLGIPWGSARESAAEEYPGHVREYGLGLTYQRFLWRGAYASLGAVPFLRSYRDAANRGMGRGFQLFLTLRAGYRLTFLDRLFLEPSVAFTAWPVTTGAPAGFAERDRRWPRYFLFEPGLHFGVEIW